jgi:hypothetical protein
MTDIVLAVLVVGVLVIAIAVDVFATLNFPPPVRGGAA